ncbi:MAG: hypothetical protein HYX27_12165 [Acidobacteria bacterium]|nr:hypothetical protein [Acidobacteriota bacterium]
MGKFALFLAAALAFAQAAADRFEGVYAGKELRLELRAAGSSSYAGSLQVQGQTYPVSARTVNRRLIGTLQSGGNRYPLQAELNGGQLRLESEGNVYLLDREVAVISVHEHPMGFTVRPAAGWSARNNENGVLLMPPDAAAQSTEEGYIAVVQDGYNAAQEAATVRNMSKQFVEHGGEMRKAGVRQQSGSVTSYYWEAPDPKSGKLAGLKVYLIPAGNRVNLLLAYGLAGRIAAREPELMQMVASLRKDAPKPVPATGPLADNTPLAQQWLRKLQGKMIRQFHAYSGMSSDKRHMLFADGRYTFRSNSMVAIDVPGASASSIGRGREEGRWQIREINGAVFLRIQYSDGSTGQYRLTQDARNWYMNGEKAFAVDPE